MLNRLPFSRRTPQQRPAPVRGVNLGGWLVLERWMTPGLFEGLSAVDEHGLCATAGAGIRNRLKQHRDTFITKDDFVWLKAQGIDAVRLPVGYWTFGGETPYLATIDYVDQAFAWASQTGIKILLDMHGAPGSQNGWDHSGESGVCAWHTDEQNIIKTLDVLSRLARRYAGHQSLLGIELLNEPKWTIPRRKLLKFYEAAYQITRDACGPDVWIVFHDGFRPWRWVCKLRGSKYVELFMDTHHYQTFSKKDKRTTAAGHLYKALRKLPKRLRRMAWFHPVVVGEWSLALDRQSLAGLSVSEIDATTRAYAAAQLLAFERTRGWFFWSYKTERGGTWSYRDAVERGWLPSFRQK